MAEPQPIRLRAHHIGNLRDHQFSRRLTLAQEELYGIESTRKAMEIYDRILEGNTPVTVVDDYDDICNFCGKRVDGGCMLMGDFYPAEMTAESDRADSKFFRVKIGKTYRGQDFLSRALE